MTLQLYKKSEIVNSLDLASDQYQRWLRHHLYESVEVEDDATDADLQLNIINQLSSYACMYPSPPLQSSIEQIRLLSLLPGRGPDDILCTLEIVALGETPEYEALSYTWGGSHKHQTICVNGISDFHVTENLITTLRGLRDAEKSRVLWVDALCINQNDAVEKGPQVFLMGKIYQMATRTVIWLGDYGIDGGLVENQDDNIQRAMDAIFWNAKPRWWERAWVVQEAVLAAEIVVRFGPYQKTWGDFCWDVLDIDSSDPSRRKREPIYVLPRRSTRWLQESEYRMEVHCRFQEIDGLRFEVHQAGTRPALWQGIRRTTRQNCTDVRDKVYSILSLVNQNEAGLIRPDYTCNHHEVFARATYAGIKERRGFEMLYLIRFWSDSIKSGFERTWAVDLQRTNDFDFSHMQSGTVFGPRWASQDREILDLVGISANAEYLTTYGVVFDCVIDQFRVASGALDQCDIDLVRCLDTFLAQLPPGETLQVPIHRTIWDMLNIPNSNWRDRVPPHRLPTNQRALGAAFEIWSEVCGVPASFREQSKIQWNELDIRRFWYYAKAAAFDVVIFTTRSGHIGLAPGTTKASDTIALWHGAQYAVLLRRCGEHYVRRDDQYVRRWCGEHWTFQGFAYVHGVMYGELLEMRKDAPFKETEFVLC